MSAEPTDSSAVFAEVAPQAVLETGALDAAAGLFTLLRNALDRLAAGEILELRSNLPDLSADLRAWARLRGHTLLASAAAGASTRYWLVRGAPGAASERPDWGLRSTRRPDGALLLGETLLGRRAEAPAEAPRYLGFVPRGAVAEAGLPEYPFRLNRREDVWADSLAELYEQARAQHWDGATDIAWAELPVLPEPLERAVCQMMTFLAENEYAALYLPAKFLPRINAQYLEAVLFLSTIISDEARHIEVFTKRALANGGGLQYAGALTEHSLHGLFLQEDYFRASFLLHVLGEGTFLDLLSFIEEHSPDAVTADIVRRARRDEGRHVAYGLAHVRRRIEAEPALAAELERAAGERSAALKEAAGGNPFVTEALAVLAGGGDRPAQLRTGFAAVEALQRRMHANRVRRLCQIGLDPDRAERISALHTPNYM